MRTSMRISTLGGPVWSRHLTLAGRQRQGRLSDRPPPESCQNCLPNGPPPFSGTNSLPRRTEKWEGFCRRRLPAPGLRPRPPYRLRRYLPPPLAASPQYSLYLLGPNPPTPGAALRRYLPPAGFARDPPTGFAGTFPPPLALLARGDHPRSARWGDQALIAWEPAAPLPSPHGPRRHPGGGDRR